MSLMNWNVKGISDIPFQHFGRGKNYARKGKFTRLEARGEGELAKRMELQFQPILPNLALTDLVRYSRT